MKKILIFLLLVLIALGGYLAYRWYFVNDNFIRQINLVPYNAVYVLQTNEPVENWKKFSESKLWNHFKQHPKFAAIAVSAFKLDQFFKDNEKLLGSIGSRDFTLSAHVTKYNDYDFLFITDLSKASKIGLINDQVENIFTRLGYKVTLRKYKGETLYELLDPATHESLYLCIVANHAVCSYYAGLVEMSIDEKDAPAFVHDNKFIEVEEKTSDNGLARLFINYSAIEPFLRCYLSDVNGAVSDMPAVMKFSGLTLRLDDEDVNIQGITNLNDSADSYLHALLQSGKGELGAYKILPARTSAFVSVGCSKFSNFYENLLRVMQQDKKTYDEFSAAVNKIEGLLKISLKDNFYSWMGDEVVLSQNQSAGLSKEEEYIISVHTNDVVNAMTNLQFVEDQIRKKTPARFETVTYKGHSVHYLEVKGLFKVLLGKLFDKVEKPYYTIIDEYVCFSNKPETIIALIEDYENKNTLENDETFKAFSGRFDHSMSAVCYVNGNRYFNTLMASLKGESRKNALDNKKYIVCFRNMAFQLTEAGRNFDTRILLDFETPAESDLNTDYSPAPGIAEKDTLSDAERFFIETFSNGAITENYDNGKPKLRAETRDGLKDGKYREYYEDGSLKVKGTYRKGQKAGKWRYYTPEGTLDHKETF